MCANLKTQILIVKRIHLILSKRFIERSCAAQFNDHQVSRMRKWRLGHMQAWRLTPSWPPRRHQNTFCKRFNPKVVDSKIKRWVCGVVGPTPALVHSGTLDTDVTTTVSASLKSGTFGNPASFVMEIKAICTSKTKSPRSQAELHPGCDGRRDLLQFGSIISAEAFTAKTNTKRI